MHRLLRGRGPRGRAVCLPRQGARQLGDRRGRAHGAHPAAGQEARRRGHRHGQRRDGHLDGPRGTPRARAQDHRASGGLRDPAARRDHRPHRDDSRGGPAGGPDHARDHEAHSRRARQQHDVRRIQRVLRPARPSYGQRGVSAGRDVCRPHMRDHEPADPGGAARGARVGPAARARRVRDEMDQGPSRRAGRNVGEGGTNAVIQRKLEVTYLPFDRSTRVPPGTTVFSAAHWIGLPIDSTCGGRGTCGKCKVRILGTPDEITGGWRLSCQAHIHEDLECEVPQLLRVPKAATMGLGRLVILDPNVRKVYVELEEPTLHDQRSDVARLRDALEAEGHDMTAEVPVLRTLPSVLRGAEFKVTAVLAGERLVAVEPYDTTGECYGIAFDVGTTTLVGTLMNLRTGMAAAVSSTLNGQAPFGADVISRISHGMNGPDAVSELQAAVVKTMNEIIGRLYAEAGVTADRTYEAVVVGNVTMLHLLFGVDPAPIAMMPFAPAFMEPLALPSAEVGLNIHPHGYVQSLPALGAYVGSDIVAGVLATGLAREDKLRIFVDVGTNGEIVIGSTQRSLATAAPAGPAFEGSQIKCGMRATDGAIEGVHLSDRVELQVIGGDVKPVGICGSGLVDAVAQLLLTGLLDHSGR